jgi:ferredoxin
MCDGFGICAKHAPEYFSLDDWGYASMIGTGHVPEADQAAVQRALLDCPVHAIIEMVDDKTGTDRALQPTYPSVARPAEETASDERSADERIIDEPVREAQMMPGD